VNKLKVLCRLKIVDFGSGSGNLILPLAHLFPACDFVAVDMKAEAINILRERAAAAGLVNVSAEVGRIEDYRYFLSPQGLLLCCLVATHR
jgi:methylase of polypeptide subunit release factors